MNRICPECQLQIPMLATKCPFCLSHERYMPSDFVWAFGSLIFFLFIFVAGWLLAVPGPLSCAVISLVVGVFVWAHNNIIGYIFGFGTLAIVALLVFWIVITMMRI